MARKTTDQNFSSQDKSRSINRQILSYNDDAKAIYYEYEESDRVVAPESAPTHSDSQATGKAPAAMISSQPTIVTPSIDLSAGPTHTSVTSLDDVPLSATDVILALTAQKLKRPLDEVSLHKSLRDLSGGMTSLATSM